MKILSFILSIMFVHTTAFANVTVASERLSTAFDRLSYDLTVNWDGKDAAQKNSIVATFENELESLRQLGLSQEELQATLESKLIDSKQVNEFRQTVAAMSVAGKSTNEITQGILPFLNASYKTGANYRSRVVIYGPTLGVVVVASILVSVILSAPYGRVTVYY